MSHRYAHCYKDGGEDFHFNFDLSVSSKKSSADDKNKKDENTQENGDKVEKGNEQVNLLHSTAPPGELGDDIQRIRAMGYEVNDDNDPAPENIPHHDIAPQPTKEAANATPATHPSSLFAEHKQEWGHHPVDQRRVYVRQNVQPSVPGIPTQMPITSHLPKSFIFLLFFGQSIFDSLIIPATNESLREDKLKETTMGEFMRWIGIWFFLSLIVQQRATWRPCHRRVLIQVWALSEWRQFCKVFIVTTK